jgi:glycosyltransferase involved in cell wall biosynthesis
MKILQVIPYFPPAYAFGGPVNVAYNVSKMLVKRGHEVVVCTTDAKDFGSRIEGNPDGIDDGLEVHRFKNVSLTLVKKFKLFVTPQLASFLKRDLKRFDVIHLHEYISFQNIVASHYAQKYKVPYVLQAHGSLPRIGNWRRLKWIYDLFFGHRLLRDASKVIALSEVEAQQYGSMGVPDEKIAVIPNGIDLSEYAVIPSRGSFKKKFGILDRKKIVLYLGRIHKTKGIDLLVKAYAYLIKEMKCSDALLVIAGPDDGYLSEVRSLVASLGISVSVLFTGFISSEDKLSALVDADVFVTPSFYGFPVTFLEACATGTPIIMTNLGDTLDWIDGNVGYVTPPSHYELAKAIYAIISDDELRRKFSRNCINIVRSKFSLEKVVTQLEKLYEEVKAS